MNSCAVLLLSQFGFILQSDCISWLRFSGRCASYQREHIYRLGHQIFSCSIDLSYVNTGSLIENLPLHLGFNIIEECTRKDEGMEGILRSRDDLNSTRDSNY